MLDAAKSTKENKESMTVAVSDAEEEDDEDQIFRRVLSKQQTIFKTMLRRRQGSSSKPTKSAQHTEKSPRATEAHSKSINMDENDANTYDQPMATTSIDLSMKSRRNETSRTSQPSGALDCSITSSNMSMSENDMDDADSLTCDVSDNMMSSCSEHHDNKDNLKYHMMMEMPPHLPFVQLQQDNTSILSSIGSTTSTIRCSNRSSSIHSSAVESTTCTVFGMTFRPIHN